MNNHDILSMIGKIKIKIKLIEQMIALNKNENIIEQIDRSIQIYLDLKKHYEKV